MSDKEIKSTHASLNRCQINQTVSRCSLLYLGFQMWCQTASAISWVIPAEVLISRVETWGEPMSTGTMRGSVACVSWCYCSGSHDKLRTSCLCGQEHVALVGLGENILELVRRKLICCRSSCLCRQTAPHPVVDASVVTKPPA